MVAFDTDALSVVIVSHRSLDVLPDAISSVAARLGGCEILVVENGLPVTSPGSADQAYDGATRVIHVRNAGFGAACNAGVAQATRPFVLFLNPDARLRRADGLSLGSESDSGRFGVAAVPMIERDGRTLEPLHRDLSWRTEIPVYLAECLFTPRWLAMPTAGPLARRGPRWISAAAMIVRRDEFNAVGGFDERIFLYHEDRDLSRRYVRAGYPLRRTVGLAAAHAAHTGSDIPTAWRIACGLASAVEMADMWENAGEPAARAVLAWLNAAERLTRLPMLRRAGVARRKCAEARAIRRQLAAVLDARPPAQYPAARAAFRRAGLCAGRR